MTDSSYFKNLVLLSLLCMSVGCASQNPSARVIKANEENEIRTAVLAYQLEHNASAQQDQTAAYCVRTGKKLTDPTDAFISRFSGHIPPVVKGSACAMNKSKLFLIYKKTGEGAMELSIGEIRYISTGFVEVEGGYYEATESASGNTYTLRKEASGWIVISDKMSWIS